MAIVCGVPNFRIFKVICRLKCFLCYITGKKKEQGIVKTNTATLSIKNGFVSRSPLSKEITQQRCNEWVSCCTL